LLGQDSIRVETVQDTFVSPQYIGEYDYLFMRHEPKKQLWKFSYPIVSSAYFRLAYERRITTGFSVEVSTNYLGSDFGNLILGSFNRLKTNIGLKYYFNKNNEIKNGLSADNLEGFYTGFRFDNFLYFDKDYFDKLYESKYGAYGVLGFQKRILNNSFIDFNLGLGVRKQYLRDGGLKTRFDYNWQVNYGWVIGKIKKANCDVLKCYEEQVSAFKIDLLRPINYVSTEGMSLKPSIAYERKLSTSFSLNFEAQPQFSYSFGDSARGKSLDLISGLELRWYPFMKKRIATGKSANNLNGWFVGLLTANEFRLSKGFYYDDNIKKTYNYNNKFKSLYFGPTLGYQQRLSRNLYYEFKIGAVRNLIGEGEDWLQSAINAKLGFAF
jgi:hypothetical protein